MCAEAVTWFLDPAPITSGSRSAGTRSPSCRAVIGPCSCRAASTWARASASHASGSSTPLSASSLAVRRCSGPISLRVAAAWTSRTTSGVATQSVRRIPWWRTTLRSSYSAFSTATSEGACIRTAADR